MSEAAKLLILINPSSGVPVYRQLIEQVRLLIAGGAIHPGDSLPSTRSLSSQLGVNPMTVSKAYGLLEQEGIVERRPGLPLVVRPFDSKPLETQRLERLGEELAKAVALVRQLGIEPRQAASLFEDLLAKGETP